MERIQYKKGSAVVTVGDELVLGEVLNTNQDFLLKSLSQAGIPASTALVVSDEQEHIVKALHFLIKNGHSPIFICGGIGGTHDDRTRQAVAQALDLPIQRHTECMEVLARKYKDRLNAQRSRMADLPGGSHLIDNPLGSPGFKVGPIYAFPGFPKMMKPMVQSVLSHYQEEEKPVFLEARFHCTEGTIATEVEKFAEEWPDFQVGLYAEADLRKREVCVKARYSGEFPESFQKAFEDLVKKLEEIAERDH